MDLDTQKSLYDVLKAAHEIADFTRGLEFRDFQGNAMARAAVERKFEIIGEALHRMEKTEATALNRISDYRRIIGFRNIIAHGYDVVDVEIVWEAITDYLPVLREEVEGLLAQ